MVERLYPGVYVTEIPYHAKPIDGVSTSTAEMSPLRAAARETQLPVPSWTQHNESDPGVTLVQLFLWLNESALFAAQPHPADRLAHRLTGWGIAQGLAVEDAASGGGSALHVSPGLASTSSGRPIEGESTTTALRVRKP